MPDYYDRLDRNKCKDIRVLTDFVSIYCREKHKDETRSIFPVDNASLKKCLGNNKLALCPDCRKLLQHGIAKLLRCPYDPKPMCKKCETHCYAPVYREKIREVMRFSGIYMVKHGRLDMMFHYFF